MNKTKALAWFDDVAGKAPARRAPGPSRVINVRRRYDAGDDRAEAHAEDAWEAGALAFVMAAEQAIKRVFPAGDPVVRRWDQIFAHAEKSPGSLTNESAVEAATALFREAHDILRSGRFETLIEGVRAETVGELVDQADAMLANGWLAAAMVTAGGAIESTLRHLCDHVSPPVEIEGHGSIEKYNAAIGKRRNEGTEILSANQSKMITAWGGLRNRAAHYPKEFSDEETKENVGNAIDGIRTFLGNLER